MQTLSNEAMMKTPLSDSLKRTIQRQRRVVRLAEPATLIDINLINPWDTTGGANPIPFLLHDSRAHAVPNLILVFDADDALDHLASSDTWFMNGNFKVSPTIFTQVYALNWTKALNDNV